MKKIISLFLLTPAILPGDYPSLFFTDQEIDFIRQKFLSFNPLEKTDKTPENLHLSALIYIDETHWVLWLNDQKIHSSNFCPIYGYRIERVTPFAVKFSWTPPKSNISRKFTLKVGQVFSPKDNKIRKNLRN